MRVEERETQQSPPTTHPAPTLGSTWCGLRRDGGGVIYAAYCFLSGCKYLCYNHPHAVCGKHSPDPASSSLFCQHARVLRGPFFRVGAAFSAIPTLCFLADVCGCDWRVRCHVGPAPVRLSVICPSVAPRHPGASLSPRLIVCPELWCRGDKV